MSLSHLLSLPTHRGSPPRILDALRCVTHHHQPSLPGHHDSPLFAARTAAPVGSITCTSGIHTGHGAHSHVSHLPTSLLILLCLGTALHTHATPYPMPLTDICFPLPLCGQLPGASGAHRSAEVSLKHALAKRIAPPGVASRQAESRCPRKQGCAHPQHYTPILTRPSALGGPGCCS